ncbi:hypothetical protein IKA92_02500, partial [bacterium]|nr:hypothetical protein [bacterium]
MGLAASQARYLDLTARKSNVEFQGQMVNQQRTELANESAGIFAEMLNLEAPVPPSASDYQTSAYNFSGMGSNSTSKYILTNWTSATGNTGTGNYDVEIKYNTGNGTAANPEYAYIYGNANLTVDGTTNRITSIFMNSFTGGDTHIQADIGIGSSNAHTTSYTKESDEIRYQEAMNKYNYDYSLYQKRMN